MRCDDCKLQPICQYASVYEALERDFMSMYKRTNEAWNNNIPFFVKFGCHFYTEKNETIKEGQLDYNKASDWRKHDL